MLGYFLLILLAFNVVCSQYSQRSPSKDPDNGKNTQEMAINHGYPCENFTVTTQDGYILLLFRIPGPRGSSLEDSRLAKRQPVILQHGLIDSSDTWLLNGNPALAYMMADAGLDVWLPNFRGNDYSRSHVSLDPDKDKKFWEFSVDEVIHFDLQAIFDFIISKTGMNKVSYVGHSMGGGSLLAACSEDRDYYAAHLRSAVLFSPSTCSLNSHNLLKFMSYLRLLDVLEFFGVNEIFNLHRNIHYIASTICLWIPELCDSFFEFLAGQEPEYDNSAKYEVFLNHYPKGTSITQFRHILQQTTQIGYYQYRKNTFDGYIPYDFTKIPSSIPLALFGGLEDKLVSIEDVRWLKEKLMLSGSLRFYKELEGHGHLTYLLPKKSYECYKDAVEFTLEKY